MAKRLLIIALSMLVCQASLTAREDSALLEGKLIDAVKYMQFGKVDEASKLLQFILLQDPENDAAYYYLANCKLRSNDVLGALDCYVKAAALDTLNLSYQRILASLYVNVGNETAAAAIYNKLRKDNPAMYSDPVTLTVLGDVALENFEDTLALRYFSDAMEQSDDYIPALLGAADVYRFRRDMPNFFATMNRFTANGSVRPEAKCQYIRGVLERMDAQTLRGWLPSLDSLVTGCIDAHPGDSSAIILASAWYYGTDRSKRGAKYVDMLLELYPDDIKANIMKMESDLRIQDYESAVGDCYRILGLKGLEGGDKLSIYSILGDCCYQLGRAREAYTWYDKALRINSGYAPVLNNYAYFLSLDGKHLGKALKMSRKTIESEPDNPTYLDTYGWILFKLGKAAEAKPYFKHAILYGGKESKEILVHYADVLKELGEDSLSDYYRNLAKDK